MSSLTRRALRVYAALSELKHRNGDVLDALIPFFEPLLEVMNGKVFDPQIFALGVQRYYRWRFTRDIAEQFIPRLERHGYLQRAADGPRGIYIVHFATSIEQSGEAPLTEVLTKIIDEFERFPPRVTDLLNYSRSREELIDILIRFLVSMDAYNPASFAEELRRMQDGREAADLLQQLEEGGRPLSSEDKYMCARFVQHICEELPDFVSDLARLASIGLLTEVVEDFLKPVEQETEVNLTVVVDAPLALDYLGCSGVALKNDVKSIFDALRGIGCKFVVYPITCIEMQQNLRSMLALAPTDRHGYTHEAMCRGEVMPEFVHAVANDPEKILESVGIQLKPLTLDQYPNRHSFFDKQRYEDFFSNVTWVAEIAPREHDASCLALTMRLREGRHHSDLFRCGYVFVTRNARFVKESRAYCLSSRLINERQEGAVIHQRELATIAWLRTGLGAGEQIPRGHLLASCDRVLRVRTEVRDAVAAKLRALTPEKVEQFELLIMDYRSLRKLADQTLNDESVVTDENASTLLEAMRLATVETEKKEFERKLEEEKAEHRHRMRSTNAKASKIRAERDDALEKLGKRDILDRSAIQRIVNQTNKTIRHVERFATALLLTIGLIGVVNYFTSFAANNKAWSVVLAAVGLFGIYHQTMNALERPKIGLATILEYLSRAMFIRRMRQAGLLERVELSNVEFSQGRVRLP